MADYLLAAHIQVTGGADAANQLNMVANAVSRLNSTGGGTGGLAGDLDKASQSSSGLAAGLSRVGDAVIRMATYQGIRFVEEGLRSAVGAVLSFDQAMTNSLAIQSGVTDTMRSRMEDLAETLAVKFGEAPAKVAEGFYFLASAGLNVQQQMADLPTVMSFAKAGMMDVDQATEMLFDSLTALGLKVPDPVQQMHNLVHVSDLLTEAAIKSQGTVEQFGAALANKSGGMIKAFGIDLNEGIGLLEVFADRGIKGAKAGDSFNQLIRDMAIKATTHADAFKRLGIEVYDSSGNFNSLLTIMTQVDHAFGPLSDAQRQAELRALGYTQRNSTLIQGLIGTSGVLAAYTVDLQNAGGVTERVANNQMTALSEKLNQLKSVSMVFAIEGFERLQEVAAWLVATFSPAVSSVQGLMGGLGASIGPVVADIAKLAVGGSMAGLEGMAGAIEKVFNAIASNHGAVEGLSAALFALGAGAALTPLIHLGETVLTQVYGNFLLAQEAINRFFISLQTMSAGGAITAGLNGIKSAFSGILDMLNTPIAAVAPAALLIYGLVHAFEDGKKRADEFYKSATQDLDMGSIAGMETAIQRMTAHMQELQAQNQQNADGGFFSKLSKVALTELDSITPGFYKFSGNLATLRGDIARTGDELGNVTKAKDNISAGFSEIGDALNHTGQYAANAIHSFDGNTIKMKEMGDTASQAGLKIDTSAPALERLAKAANIDLSSGWEEWAPLLEEAAIRAAAVGDVSGNLSSQMLTLADDAASAADKLKAFGDTLDEVFGAPLSKFESITAVEEALQGLNEALGKFKEGGGDIANAFDITSKAGLDLRNSLSGVADDALKVVQNLAKTDGIPAAMDALGGYRERIMAVLTAQGLAPEAASAMIDSLGLTVDAIAGVKMATGPDGIKVPVSAPGAPETNQQIKEISGDHKAAVTVDVDNEGVATFKVNMDGATAPRTASVMPAVDQGAASVAFTALESLGSSRTAPINAEATPDAIAQADAAFLGVTLPRTAPINATDNGTAATVGGQFDTTVLPRTAPATMNGEWADAEIGFNTTVLPRTAPATMAGDWTAAEIGFNTTVQPRTAPALMAGSWSAAELGFNNTARHRPAPATMNADTGGAEVALNSTARPRSSTATAFANTGSAEAALNRLSQDRYATVHVNVAVTGNTSFNTGQLADGGVIHPYASGGFENHGATIARANTPMRLWNEPETGGEAYIPLAISKRDRSLAIWEETGRILGAGTNTTRNVNVNVPINVSVDGAGDPTATAQAVAGHVKQGVDAALSRVLIELRSV